MPLSQTTIILSKATPTGSKAKSRGPRLTFNSDDDEGQGENLHMAHQQCICLFNMSTRLTPLSDIIQSSVLFLKVWRLSDLSRSLRIMHAIATIPRLSEIVLRRGGCLRCSRPQLVLVTFCAPGKKDQWE